MSDVAVVAELTDHRLADVALRVAEEVIVHKGDAAVVGWAGEAFGLLQQVEAARRTADTTAKV